LTNRYNSKTHEQTPIVVGERGEKNAVEGIDEHLEENGEDSENSEDNDEGMGDADIGGLVNRKLLFINL
jgi:hypothetical protein